MTFTGHVVGSVPQAPRPDGGGNPNTPSTSVDNPLFHQNCDQLSL